MLNEKATIVLLRVGLLKNIAYISEYFPEPKSLESRVND